MLESSDLRKGLKFELEGEPHVGDKLRAALHSEFGQHPHIGDIRGRGLFLGLEVVEDRGTRKPFDPAKNSKRPIWKKLKWNIYIQMACGSVS